MNVPTMTLLVRGKPTEAGAVPIVHEAATGRSELCHVHARSPQDTELLTRLFVQSPVADQLVREALAIIDAGELLDVRDWLRAARAYVETIDEESPC